MELTNVFGELVERFGPGCSGHVCDNVEVQKAVAAQMARPEAYQAAIRKVREAAPAGKEAEEVEVTGQRMRRQDTPERQPDEATTSRRTLIIWSLLALCAAAVLVGGRRRARRR